MEKLKVAVKEVCKFCVGNSVSYQGRIMNTLPLRATKPHGHQLAVYQSIVTVKLETTWVQFRVLHKRSYLAPKFRIIVKLMM